MMGVVRGAIITYGIVALTLVQQRMSNEPANPSAASGAGPLTWLVLGIGLQAARWLVLRLVARHEQAHGLEGTLSPTVAHVVDLLVDGITVLLFALATFQGLLGAAANV